MMPCTPSFRRGNLEHRHDFAGMNRSVENEWRFCQFVQMVQYEAQQNGNRLDYLVSERY